MEPYDLLKYVVTVFEKLDVNYLITGSIASMFYGEPRLTNDIDIVADIREHHIQELKGYFPEKDFYISENAIRGAIKHKQQFNIIHPSSGFKIDVMIPGDDDFNKSRFERKNRISPVEKTKANFSSPEDVIIMKMRYYEEGGSEKHIRDITGMLRVSSDIIDKNYIDEWVKKFNLDHIWRHILAKLENRQ